MPKRPSKAELRKALDTFLPPEANVEWADEWKPNALAARRREATTPDDPQVVPGKDNGANAVGRLRTRHPSEGRR
jgi:hypothetical protein